MERSPFSQAARAASDPMGGSIQQSEAYAALAVAEGTGTSVACRHFGRESDLQSTGRRFDSR